MRLEPSRLEQAVLDELVQRHAGGASTPTLTQLALAVGRSCRAIKTAVKGLVRKGYIRATDDGHGIEILDLPVPGLVKFTVWGIPRPQGSKTVFIHPSGKGAVAIESSAGLPFWRDLVYYSALEHRPTRPFVGPIEVAITFYFRRPRRPKYDRPHSRPDTDKLERAVHDALVNAGIMVDDGQVSDSPTRKRWGDQPGAEIVVRALVPQEGAP